MKLGMRNAALAVLVATAVTMVGCSGNDAEKTSGARPASSGSGSEGSGSSGESACAEGPRLGTKPAKFLDACLAPSVVQVAIDGIPYGTGFIVSAKGEQYVATNLHVIDPAPTADVVLTGDDATTLKDLPVVGVDKAADLALIGPIETDRPSVDVTGPTVEKGDDVYLVGYPGENQADTEVTISRGLVSKLRHDDVFDLHYVQTDASIGHGQSGGALADERGHVIGMSGLAVADEFALALDGTDVQKAIDRIIDGDGDDYWTFPSTDPKSSSTSGTLELSGIDDFESLLLETEDATTVELNLDPTTVVGLAVTDYDTGENLFTDRAAVAANMAAMGMTPDPAMIDQVVKEQGLKLGDAVAPGSYRIDVPADRTVSFDLAPVAAAGGVVKWTSNVALAYQARDEVDVPLELDKPHQGAIDLFEFDSTFTIDLEAGQKVNVRVSTPTGDPEVVITAPGQSYADGTVLSDSDTGLYGTDIDEGFTADGAGTYTLTLEAWGDAAMPYEMEISAAKGD